MKAVWNRCKSVGGKTCRFCCTQCRVRGSYDLVVFKYPIDKYMIFPIFQHGLTIAEQR
jgi:hypothetical protein